MRVFVLVAIVALIGPSCAEEVDCDALCTRTLLCEVTFAPRDDLEGEKIASGERTVAASCAIGCTEQPAVTLESARCVDQVTDSDQDPVTCQPAVLICFGLDPGIES